MVWRQLWPAVKEQVLCLFRASLDQGLLPTQWKKAKIIPLKKPNKGNYAVAKSWRPISLLSTLGKILEAVVAERVSYVVEKHGLLPANHFGGRKQRSTEQALLLLQERIYNAWRARKVVSLVSFDIKGAYNGVCKERLLQRLSARGIPPRLVQWVNAFCSERTATIQVNGFTSTQRDLPQAGLPQGSPLSPILFLFFSADLVQHQINANGGSIAFIDDYNAWVTGTTAEENYEGLRTIIEKATDWEKRSGATFEGDKTMSIHFTRNANRTSTRPIVIKGQEIRPATEAKILGVIMDTELRYKQHIARAATSGLQAAMALQSLRSVSPRTARQLFEATVVPVVDYASNVWMHACGGSATTALNRVQKIGAQAVTGCFRTVATAVAEAEASIRPVHERHKVGATKLWFRIQTLPAAHPLRAINTRAFQRFVSPLQKIAQTHQETAVDRMETIHPHAVSPWTDRIPAVMVTDEASVAEEASQCQGVRIATSASVRGGMVGTGWVAEDSRIRQGEREGCAVTIGSRMEQNPYTAELKGIATALRSIPTRLVPTHITIFTSSQSAMKAVHNPGGQSGQDDIRQIYMATRKLREGGSQVSMMWVPAKSDFGLKKRAKTAARLATAEGHIPNKPSYQAKPTVTNRALKAQRKKPKLPRQIGAYSKRIDAALPGVHTRALYDGLKRNEAGILAQLRTGMIRLNGYLHQIGAVESDLCPCGKARETVEHFLFRCTKWDTQRRQMLRQTDDRIGNLPFYLGGKALSEPGPWSPNTTAVKATIHFTIATNRLHREQKLGY